MKKKYLLMTTLIFLSQLTSPINTLATIENSQEYKVADNSDSEAIDDWMPDKNVQNIVMTALGVPTVNSITKDLMNQLTSFSAEQSTFTSFEGLQYATNLDTLSLVSCQLPSDFKLSFFAENIPKLKTLRISNSGLSDINLSGYITFYNLDTLDFSKNNLSGTLTDFNQFGWALQLTDFNVADNNLSGGLITDLVPIPAIDAIDKTIKVGDKWEAADNFVSAQDLNGDILNLDQLVVSGEVDTDTPGDYEVVYTRNFENTWNNYIYKKVIIHVLTDPTLEVQNMQIFKGSKWSPKDNFISATNEYGVKIPFENVQVSGSVDTNIPGEYNLTYSYGSIEKNVVVEVLNYLLGDINKDGVVDLDDLIALKAYLNDGALSEGVSEDYVKKAGDLNSDGVVDLDDLVALANILNG
ncbi:bacterial Ig-like domain-containing protein [Enterococcus sp. ALS3]|uniref:Bacterial Ig-like domain-containing protein n=1 Tax=Enterococcus alishanensis TaxID=1303817 RepID=A0ABS6TF48_9ENTE|nr:bacterial Ig-like domain-containing protein [Enterococcus alishanensis]MBV7391508.1 bacterial Ig-like domain-containing protein [Enterococcus alishanensis]